MEEPTTSSAAQMMQTNDSFAAKWVQFLSPPEWRGRVEVEFREVPLCQLQSAGCCLDRDVVNGWVERPAGWAGGLVASALNSAAAAFLLLPPFGSPLIANHEHAAQLLLTAVTMVAASIYVGVSGRSASFSRLRHRS